MGEMLAFLRRKRPASVLPTRPEGKVEIADAIVLYYGRDQFMRFSGDIPETHIRNITLFSRPPKLWWLIRAWWRLRRLDRARQIVDAGFERPGL